MIRRSAVVLLACSALVLSCGQSSTQDDDLTGSNNGASNNGGQQSNNGGSANNGGTNNGSANNGAGTNNQTTGNNGTQEVTYHADVRPLLEANCVGCHIDGGIGPFGLTSYEEVAGLAGLLAATAESGRMPPWPPAQDCGNFRHERTLEAEEIATLRAWADAGAPQGDPADYVAPPESDIVELGEPDYVVDVGVEYTADPPDGGVDDYHCFAIEHGFDEDKFLNAYNTNPGEISVVHHMLFWQVPTSARERIQQLENEDPDTPGWTCFGGNRTGEEAGLLGGWTPGAVPVKFGEGEGIRIPADSLIVVQLHYNTVNGAKPDRTTIDLHFTDGPATTALGMYPMPDTSLFLAAGDANATAGTQFTLPIRTKIYGVFPHMHMLGTRIRVTGTRNGEETCFVDVPEWDFNWQGLYLYEEPVEVRSGTTLELECWYDNSAANQPDGRTPRDVTWGDGTYDEMCLNYFITEELPL